MTRRTAPMAAAIFALTAALSQAQSTPNADADLRRGLALAQSGRLDEAERAFLEGQRLYPEDSRFWLELAGVAYLRKDTGTAKRRLMNALRLDPTSAYGNDFLASLFLMEGNLPAALKYWNRIGKPLIEDLRFDPAPDLQPILQERALAISAGQVFTLDRLWTTEDNLDRLDALPGYQFGLTPLQDERFDLTFRSLGDVQPLSGWLGLLLPLVRALPYQTVDFDLINIGQRAIDFTSLGRWDPEKRRLALGLAAPLGDNPRFRYRLGTDMREENWDLSTTYFGPTGGQNGLVPNGLILRTIETGGDVEIALTNRLQWTSGLWITGRDFQNDFLNGGSSPFFANGWSVELRNALSRRLWIWPERRVHADASAELIDSRTLTGGPARFNTVKGELSGVWLPQAKGDDWEVTFRARAARSFGTVPLDEMFILGMERDNDLWLRGFVGTRDGRKGSAPLGSEYTLFQTDLARTVFKFPFIRLQVGPFFDTGQIGDPSGQFGSRGWIEATGLQAQIKILGSVTGTLVYGRNLSNGRGAFYTATTR